MVLLSRRGALLAAVALLLVSMGRAQDEAGAGGAGDENLGDYASQFQEEEAPKKPTTHPDVTASSVFPDFGKPRFPMGEPVDVLVAFANAGKQTFNVVELGGTLNSPYDFSFIVQNFTRSSNVMTLQPNEQRSAIFTFIPDGRLEALDFQLHLYAKYEGSDGAQYTQILFNQTATLIESASETSSKILFVLTLCAVVAALAGFKVYTYYQKYDKKNKKKAKRAEAQAAAQQPNLSDEWLTGMPGIKSKKVPKSGGDKARPKKDK